MKGIELSPVPIGRRTFLRLTALSAAGFVAAACRYPEQSRTTEIGDRQMTQGYGVTIEAVSGKTSIELFTSKKHYFRDKELEVTEGLTNFVNSGANNITEIQTSYSSGYLTAARADHIPDAKGRGNKLRVQFVQSEKYYFADKHEEITKKLKAFTSVIENPYKVNTIFESGFLVAAEVWYFQ